LDAEAVRAVYAEEPEFGRATVVRVGRVVARRLYASRVRLLGLHAPAAAGGVA
jgi:hypothetical protein